MAIIAASILDADHSQLRHEISRVARAGVDAFSLDVMDGIFVPRITFDDYLVAAIRTCVELPLEVHLMVDRPEAWVKRICDAGADMVVFHLEATADPCDVVRRIRDENRAVGLAIKCETDLAAISDELLSQIDLVNLMAVPIGFGGNASAPDTLDRVRELRKRSEVAGVNVAIEVDGGVKPSNVNDFVKAGADMLTVGTGIYHADDVDQAVRILRDSTDGALGLEARARLYRSFLSVPSRMGISSGEQHARLDALRVARDIRQCPIGGAIFGP